MLNESAQCTVLPALAPGVRDSSQQAPQLRSLAVPAEVDVHCLESLVMRRRRLPTGAHLFQQNQAVNDRLYVIQSGHIKTYQLSADGHQAILGLHMPGQFLGLDVMGLERHRSYAATLCSTVVCEFSCTALADAARDRPAVGQYLTFVLTANLERQQRITVLLQNRHATHRFAAFLLDRYDNMLQQGHATALLQLPMTRQEVGDYLGLSGPSVSRALHQLKRTNCIAVQRRALQIADLDQLKRYAAA